MASCFIRTKEFTQKSKDYSILLRIVSYIEENFSQKISLSTLDLQEHHVLHLHYFVSDSKDEPQGIGQEQAVCCTSLLQTLCSLSLRLEWAVC